MWTVKLLRGRALATKTWQHTTEPYAMQRANALAYLHGDTTPEVDTPNQTVTIDANEHYERSEARRN